MSRGRGFDSNFQLNEKEPDRKIKATKVAHLQKQLEYIPRVHCGLYENLEALLGIIIISVIMIVNDEANYIL